MRLPKLKQHNIPWLGAFTESLFESLPILSIFNFMSILIVLYATVYEIVHEFAPWLTFWHFIGVLAVVVIIGLVLVHKYVVPSLWTFRQNQMLLHESDMLKEIKAIREELQPLRNLNAWTKSTDNKLRRVSLILESKTLDELEKALQDDGEDSSTTPGL